MNSIFTNIKLLHKPYTQQINKVLEPHQVSELQWGLLRYLKEVNPATFTEIATYWRVEKPSVTPVAQKLIEQELIEILQGKDKRQKVMHLTATGLVKYEKCKATVEAYQAKLFEGLTNQQIESVNEVIMQITANVMKRG